jgi:hypothetical protein
MNWFDDIRKAERTIECEHLWILKKDGTVYCHDCKIRKEDKK